VYQDPLTLCSFYFLKAFSPSDYPLWEKLSRKSPWESTTKTSSARATLSKQAGKLSSSFKAGMRTETGTLVVVLAIDIKG